jgi:uncharacterized membrane protein
VESDLVAVWRTTGGHRFRNYRARFTVLDVPSVFRAWISELASGQTTGESCPAPAAGVLLALLAAALHAVYILLGRRGWDRADDGAATFLIVATAALGLGAIAAATRPATMLAPASDLPLTGLLLLDGALAGAAAPLLFLAGLRRTGATRTAVVSLCEPLAAALLAAVMLGQLLSSSQLAGGALLLGAGIAIQTVPARPVRSARVGQAPRTGTRQPRAPATKQSHLRSRDHGNQLEQHEAHR